MLDQAPEGSGHQKQAAKTNNFVYENVACGGSEYPSGPPNTSIPQR
jgi:hypothetical protein